MWMCENSREHFGQRSSPRKLAATNLRSKNFTPLSLLIIISFLGSLIF